MREILFRGKVINSVWTYGYYVKNGATHYIYNAEDGVYVVVDPKSIGQYTGLTDKNGKQIFEGDIVKDEFGRIMKVVFIECWGKYQFTLVKATGERWTNNFTRADLTDWFIGVCPEELPEIIGNIYDNPELLGGIK